MGLFFQNDWHAQVAKHTLATTEEYDIECWRPYLGIEEVYSRNVDGITHRLFPAVNSTYFGFLSQTFSQSLVNEFNTNYQNGKILVHFWGLHSKPVIDYLSKLNLTNVPTLVQHAGSSRYKLRADKTSSLIKKAIFYYRDYREKNALTSVDHVQVLQEEEYASLKDWFSDENLSIGTVGINFDSFGRLRQFSAREKLKIGIDKKVILFVGHFNEVKGIEHIVIFFQKYKAKLNLELILVGGSRNNTLFNDVDIEDVIIKERINQGELRNYYYSADVYAHPAFHDNHKGTDGTVIEALFCGLPVVSKILNYLGNDDGVLGKACETNEEFEYELLKIIENLENFKNDKLLNERRMRVQKSLVGRIQQKDY